MNAISKEELKRMEKQAFNIAKAYMGKVAWPSIIFGISVIAVFITTALLLWNQNLALTLGFFITTLASYAAYTILHDAVHGSINGKNPSFRWVNDGLGYLAGQIMQIPFKVHRLEHFAHHIHTNKPDKDPDLYINGDGLWKLIKGTLVVMPLHYKFLFKEKWHTLGTKDKLVIITELVIMYSWRFAFLAFGHWQAFLVLIAANFMAIFILVTLFVWLVHRPFGETQRYKNTNTIILPKYLNTLVTWLWLQQNYHSIHHLYPNIPFYAYKKVFEQIEDVMLANQAPIIRI